MRIGQSIWGRFAGLAAIVAALLMGGGLIAWAGQHFQFNQNQVGGISVNPLGVVANFQVDAKKQALDVLRKSMAKVGQDLAQPVELRMVSLKKLEAALDDAIKNHAGAIPDDILYLAGIQRIKYVFVYPEANDIVLAGPGEGWRLDENANVVGVTTGRPVIHLDDLMVALRWVKTSAQTGITCSIDPTDEGRQKFAQFMAAQKTFNPRVIDGAAAAMGAQKITLQGIPGESHMARVLVAADFRMKRIGMKLDPSPVNGLESFVDMLAKSNVNPKSVMPRWWLACNYEKLSRSEDGLAWELNGPGVKCLTEEDFVNAAGKVTGAGKSNPVAQKWADTMTAKYDELSAKDSVFGELRNVMDLCVVAAIIEKHDLLGRADLKLPLLMDQKSPVHMYNWNVPKSVATQCSFLHRGKDYIITASGGVEIDGFAIAQANEVNKQVSETRTKASPAEGNRWWW